MIKMDGKICFFIGSYYENTRILAGKVCAGQSALYANEYCADFDIDSISYMVTTPDAYLLGCIEKSCYQGQPGGAIAAFRITEEGLALTDCVRGLGSGSCHVCYTPHHRWIFVSNYGDGSIDMLRLSENGKLTKLKHIRRLGGGPLTEQYGPHAHCSLAPDNEETLFVCDLGTDQIGKYSLPDMKLTDNIQFPGGTGPRHAVFSKDESVLYVACELGNDVFVMHTDGSVLQHFNLQIDKNVFTAVSSVRLTEDYSHLVVGIRGDNKIAIFPIQKGNNLLGKPVVILTEEKYPWDIVPLTKDASILLTAFEQSDCVQLLQISATGKVQILGEMKAVHPTCICLK